MPLHASEAILLEIGRITVWQSRLEGQLAFLLSKLSGDGELVGLPARPSHADLATQIQQRLITNLGNGHVYVNEFKAVRRQIEEVVSRRNKVVHSIWSLGPDFDPNVGTRIPRTKIHRDQTDFVSVRVEDLKALSLDFEALDWAVSELRIRLCEER
jgi:hypothetical protein